MKNKNVWSRYRSNFGFGGMGLDREKNVVKKNCGSMEFIFVGVPPRHQSGCFFTPERFSESGTGKILCLAVPDPDS
jgi:hypothetical protein